MHRILRLFFLYGVLNGVMGCTTHPQVECNTRLQPINAPAAKVVATDQVMPVAGGAL